MPADAPTKPRGPKHRHFKAAEADARIGMVAEMMRAEARIGKVMRPRPIRDVARGDAESIHRAAELVLSEEPDNAVALTYLAASLNRAGEHAAAADALRRVLDTPRLSAGDRNRVLLELRRLDLLAPSPDAAWRAELWSAEAVRPTSLGGRFLPVLRRIADGETPDTAALEQAMADRVAHTMAALPEGPERTALERLRQAGRVALVGNGPSVLGQGAGPEIDAHDCIVRLNFPKISGYGADVGTRTDVVVFTGTKRGTVPLWLAREPSFRGVPALAMEKPPAETVQRDPPAMPAPLHHAVIDLGYGTSTTGFRSILLIALLLRRPTSLYGFDFFRPGATGHYFGHTAPPLIHEVAYERWVTCTALPVLRPDLRFNGAPLR